MFIAPPDIAVLAKTNGLPLFQYSIELDELLEKFKTLSLLVLLESILDELLELTDVSLDELETLAELELLHATDELELDELESRLDELLEPLVNVELLELSKELLLDNELKVELDEPILYCWFF